jgi:hypothetical protein
MRRALSLFFLSALWMPSQDLPPEVLTLARIHDRVREAVERLPDCTCVETVARFRKSAGLQILFSGVCTVDPSKWSSRRGACEFDWYWSANPPSRRRRTDQPASSGLRAFHIHVTVAFQTHSP